MLMDGVDDVIALHVVCQKLGAFDAGIMTSLWQRRKATAAPAGTSTIN